MKKEHPIESYQHAIGKRCSQLTSLVDPRRQGMQDWSAASLYKRFHFGSPSFTKLRTQVMAKWDKTSLTISTLPSSSFPSFLLKHPSVITRWVFGIISTNVFSATIFPTRCCFITSTRFASSSACLLLLLLFRRKLVLVAIQAGVHCPSDITN